MKIMGDINIEYTRTPNQLKDIKESQMEPPHIGEEAPRDKNGIPYSNRRNRLWVRSKIKARSKRKTPTPVRINQFLHIDNWDKT